MSPSQRLFRVGVLLLVILPFLGTLLAIYYLWNRYVFPSDIILMLVGVVLTGLGVTIGYHRMLTHQGFQTYPWLKGLILIFGTMAFEGDPIGWTGRHIQHHAHSDEEGDPHSPLDGFWHAHLGWIFEMSDSFEVGKKYAPHLFQDPVVVFVQRTTLLWMALSLLIPFAIGGWTGLVWGGAVRLFITTHTTFSINSICHCFGQRTFHTTDESRNNFLVALFTFGEGWHNNHHAFPQSAFHGLRWWQIDFSGLLLRLLERIGVIWQVQRVSEETIQSHLARQDASLKAQRDLFSQVSQSLNSADEEFQRMFGSIIAQSLEPDQLANIAHLQSATQTRLAEIRKYLERAKNMKRPALMAYQREVQDMLQRVRSTLQTVPVQAG